jgi:1D-myo-inositol 3-kinase
MSIDQTPDYLVIGHVAKDLLPSGDGAVAGGTVTYAAILAHRLGLQSAIVTSCRPEDDYLLDAAREEGVWVSSRPSPATTTFLNRYDREGHRQQVLSAQADLVRYEDVPEAWRSAPIVHLGPIARELPAGIVTHF